MNSATQHLSQAIFWAAKALQETSAAASGLLPVGQILRANDETANGQRLALFFDFGADGVRGQFGLIEPNAGPAFEKLLLTFTFNGSPPASESEGGAA